MGLNGAPGIMTWAKGRGLADGATLVPPTLNSWSFPAVFSFCNLNPVNGTSIHQLRKTDIRFHTCPIHSFACYHQIIRKSCPPCLRSTALAYPCPSVSAASTRSELGRSFTRTELPRLFAKHHQWVSIQPRMIFDPFRRVWKAVHDLVPNQPSPGSWSMMPCPTHHYSKGSFLAWARITNFLSPPPPQAHCCPLSPVFLDKIITYFFFQLNAISIEKLSLTFLSEVVSSV